VRFNRDKKICQGLLLKPTFFGWIPSGKAIQPISSTNTTLTTISCEKTVDQQKLEFLHSPDIQFLWELEVLGIRQSEINSTNDTVIDFFHRTTRFENNRYFVKFPHRVENLKLPTLFRMCVARLMHSLKSEDKAVLLYMDETIKKQLSLGIVEKAPRDSRYCVHYNPQQPVVKEDKEVRTVYDASTKQKSGQSLNELLHAGPPLTTSLLEILLNFCLRKIAVTADIEKAFFQMRLDEADRDLVRFVWVEDINAQLDQIKLISLRFSCPPFGVISSPFLLNMVLQEHMASPDSEIFQQARRRYVDNFVLSVADVNLAVCLFELITDYLALASSISEIGLPILTCLLMLYLRKNVCQRAVKFPYLV